MLERAAAPQQAGVIAIPEDVIRTWKAFNAVVQCCETIKV